MEIVIKNVVNEAGVDPKAILGICICIDTTGSSPQPIDRNGTPLCLNKGFEENPNAMTVLWKDHTAIAEADEINQLARNWGGEDYTKFEGGIYSSEWFWAKILHISRVDEKVKNAAYSWMEHCDLMTYILVGSPHFHRSPEADVPLATKPCGTKAGEDYRAMISYPGLSPIWSKLKTTFIKIPSPQIKFRAIYPLNGARNSDLPKKR